MANKNWPAGAGAGEVLRNDDIVGMYKPSDSPDVDGSRNKQKSIEEWRAEFNSEGIQLTPGRISDGEKIIQNLVSSGRKIIAKIDNIVYQTADAEFVISIDGQNTIYRFRAGVATSTSTFKQNHISYVSIPVLYNGVEKVIGIEIGYSPTVSGAGAIIVADFDSTVIGDNVTVKIIGNIGVDKGWELVAFENDTGLLPDGVTLATYLEAGAEYRSLVGTSNPPSLRYAKISNDVISLVVNFNQIPKQSPASLLLSYSTLTLFEATTSAVNYPFDGSEVIGSPVVVGTEVYTQITKVGAFTSFTNSGNVVRTTSLVVTLS